MIDEANCDGGKMQLSLVRITVTFICVSKTCEYLAAQPCKASTLSTHYFYSLQSALIAEHYYRQTPFCDFLYSLSYEILTDYYYIMHFRLKSCPFWRKDPICIQFYR